MRDRPRLFVSNIEFEHRLVHGAASLPRSAENARSAVAAGWRLIAREGDALWWSAQAAPCGWNVLDASGLPRLTLVSRPEALAESHEVVFWAEDDWACEVCRRWGFAGRGCEPDIVRLANSRRLQTSLEQEFGVAPAGLRETASIDELSAAVGAFDVRTGWVLKNEFGAAGRESRRGYGALPPNVARWAAARFRRGFVIVVEPRLAVLEEASIHFTIDRTGDVTYLGVVGGQASAGGTFLASTLFSDKETRRWQTPVSVAARAAKRLAEVGYRGPLGIDAMRYRDAEGQERWRPIQDINARYTIGRLALGMDDYPEFRQKRQGQFTPGDWR